MNRLWFKKKKRVQQVKAPDYNLIRDDQNSNLAKLILFGLGLYVAIRILLDND